MTISLAKLVERLRTEGVLAAGAGLDGGAEAAEVRDITTDSRIVTRGSLFCAVRGVAGDGHTFVGDAERLGAVAAVVEERVNGVDLPQIQVVDGRLGAAFAAAEYFDDPWNEMTLVGITGTNGKTTTTAILRHLLNTAGPTGSIGTLGALGPDGQVIPGTEGLTTPGPVALGRWLRLLSGDGTKAVAMEVSSHSLHQRRVAAARFDTALFTNLSRDHLDYHETFENYRAAKMLLVDLIKPGGSAVVNADDPAWGEMRPSGVRHIRFAVSAPADVRATEVSASPGGMSFTLHTPDGSAPARVPLFGLFNVSNALGAAAVLWSLGWPLEKITAGLEQIPQVPGRLERVPTPAGTATVLIDYAHTADALERALTALRPLVSGRLVVVFGAGGDRDTGKRQEMGRVAAACADLSIVTSDNPRTEDPTKIAQEVEAGMGNAPRERLLDRRQAIARAIELTTERDLVLLAGKGHETYQIWGEEKRPFDERVVVREIHAVDQGAS